MKPIFDDDNNKERLPFIYYLSLFESADPFEISRRTGLKFDDKTSTFEITFLSSHYSISFPDFNIEKLSGEDDTLSCGWPPAQILVLRYLVNGRCVENISEFCSYQDMPWGSVYYQQFYGRCILRLAYSFGGKREKLDIAMKRLNAIPYEKGDSGYEFLFMEGLKVRISIWDPDDEFPPSAQILFSDNFRFAFSAEDMAFVGDIFIRVLKSN